MAEAKKQDSSGWLIIGLIVALLYFAPSGSNQHQPTPAPVIIKGALLVNVLEKKNPTVEQELVLRESAALVAEKELAGHRDLDDDLDEVQPLIRAVKAQFNVDPPFSALQSGKTLLKAAPMKDVAALRELVK